MRPKLPCSRSCRRSSLTSRSVSWRSTALFSRILQPLRIDGLTQIVVGAVLDRVDGALDRALRRQQDEGDVRQLILQGAEQIVAAHPRHHEVAHDDGRPEAGDLAEPFLAVGGLVGLEPPGLNELGQPGPRCRVVLDDQDSSPQDSRS